VRKGVLLPLGPKAENGRARLNAVGVSVVPSGDAVQVTGVKFGSRAEKLGIEQGFSITGLELPQERPAKEWLFLPALIVLGLIATLQRRRNRAAATSPA
jgi:hypothetical protein